MAYLVASVRPSAPSINMYAYDIASIMAEPQGADETASMAFSPPVFTTGLPGRNGAR